MNQVCKICNDIFSGKDNKTVDLGRVLWAAGVVVYFALSIHAVWVKTWIFDPVAWGTGFGAILAAGGAALWAKSSTEPDEPDSIRRTETTEVRTYPNGGENNK